MQIFLTSMNELTIQEILLWAAVKFIVALAEFGKSDTFLFYEYYFKSGLH